jgi:dTDP-4-dehydrorhamnose reductase
VGTSATQHTERRPRRIHGLIRVGALPGFYHATSSGETTWYGLAKRCLPGPGPRPSYSVLGHAAWASAGIPPIPDWRESLNR